MLGAASRGHRRVLPNVALEATIVQTIDHGLGGAGAAGLGLALALDRLNVAAMALRCGRVIQPSTQREPLEEGPGRQGVAKYVGAGGVGGQLVQDLDLADQLAGFHALNLLGVWCVVMGLVIMAMAAGSRMACNVGHGRGRGGGDSPRMSVPRGQRHLLHFCYGQLGDSPLSISGCRETMAVGYSCTVDMDGAHEPAVGGLPLIVRGVEVPFLTLQAKESSACLGHTVGAATSPRAKVPTHGRNSGLRSGRRWHRGQATDGRGKRVHCRRGKNRRLARSYESIIRLVSSK